MCFGIDMFLIVINNLHPNIKFTIEKEHNRSINFLDLNIKINTMNKLEFSIFRKPTHTDIIIPNDSCHYKTHKLAAYKCLVDRAMPLPFNTNNFNNEILIIKK